MSGTISFRRLSAFGAVAIVVSALVNLALRVLLMQLFQLSPAFIPLGIGPVIFWSVISGIAAVLVFALVARRARRPVTTYLLIAIGAYVLTFIPDGLLLFSNLPFLSGKSVYAVITLMSMHAAEAIIIILTLTTLWTHGQSRK